jgi:alpha-1,3-mannosyltransferase
VRVVHVVSQFHPSAGSTEALVLKLARQQRLAGVNAEVVTLNRLPSNPTLRLPAYDCVQGVPVRRIGYVGSSKYPMALDVLACIQPFDIVHVHGAGFFSDYLALTKILHRKPLVVSPHIHGLDERKGLARILRRHILTRLSLWKFSRVFACSFEEKTLFPTLTNRRLILIDNGVDVARFADAGSRAFAPSLVYFSPPASEGGIDTLIATFCELLVHIPDVRLHLVSQDRDGSLSGLQQRLDESGLGAAITLHANATEAETRSVIARGCFFISASSDESAQSSLVEAAAAGLVPIVGRNPAFARVLGETGPGLLVEFADPTGAGMEIAAFMRKVGELYGDFRAEATQLAAPHSWPNVSRRYVREYECVLGASEREILGVSIRSFTRDQAIVSIDCALQSGERLNVGFANAHSLNIASTNNAFREALRGFLVLNDGLGLDIASRIKFGRPFTANLNGTDFVPYFLAKTRHRLRIYLIGTTDDVVAQAAQSFRARYPWHSVVGWRSGFFTGPDDIEETCRGVRATKADCVLVGMGNPLQELWIADHGAKTGAKLLIGVGALFDFTAERVHRAPSWVQSLRCEWVYRLLQEPRRLVRRYLIGNVVFLTRAITDGRS